jgi:hypothetical protein
MAAQPNNAVRAAPDRDRSIIKLSLIKDGNELGPVEFAAKDAAKIAGVILSCASAARKNTNEQQKPKTEGDSEEVDATVIRPSAVGIGRRRKQGNAVLMVAHFGDTSLALELSNPREFAQKILTVAADETTRQ